MLKSLLVTHFTKEKEEPVSENTTSYRFNPHKAEAPSLRQMSTDKLALHSTTMSTKKLAFLIDSDSVSPQIMTGLLAKVAHYGTASERRVYGDWTYAPNLNSWKACVFEHALTPVQQFADATGRNASDGTMIIDAMDLLHSGRFAGFCLVCDNGDFGRLAARIRQQAVAVYGFGERETPYSFIKACDRFVFFDVLARSVGQAVSSEDVGQVVHSGDVDVDAAAAATATTAFGPAGAAGPVLANATGAATTATDGSSTLEWQRQLNVYHIAYNAREIDAATLQTLRYAVQLSISDLLDGWSKLSIVEVILKKEIPDFDFRDFGFTKLLYMVRASNIVDIRFIKRDAVVKLKESSVPPGQSQYARTSCEER
jgi:hypothetical protein